MAEGASSCLRPFDARQRPAGGEDLDAGLADFQDGELDLAARGRGCSRVAHPPADQGLANGRLVRDLALAGASPP